MEFNNKIKVSNIQTEIRGNFNMCEFHTKPKVVIDEISDSMKANSPNVGRNLHIR